MDLAAMMKAMGGMGGGGSGGGNPMEALAAMMGGGGGGAPASFGGTGAGLGGLNPAMMRQMMNRAPPRPEPEFMKVFPAVGPRDHSLVPDPKTWVVLYPCYLDGTWSKAQGRRVKKESAPVAPSFAEVCLAVSRLGVLYRFEPNKTHPSDFFRNGRVRVCLKDTNGTVINDTVSTRQELFDATAAQFENLERGAIADWIEEEKEYQEEHQRKMERKAMRAQKKDPKNQQMMSMMKSMGMENPMMDDLDDEEDLDEEPLDGPSSVPKGPTPREIAAAKMKALEAAAASGTPGKKRRRVKKKKPTAQ